MRISYGRLAAVPVGKFVAQAGNVAGGVARCGRRRGENGSADGSSPTDVITPAATRGIAEMPILPLEPPPAEESATP